MGAHPTDYARSAPYRSYIHVDEFESPKELAEYLHRLDRDDELYNSYFRWKGTGEFINTYFWCRVCAMLHDDRPSKFYKDVNEWWRGDGICTTTSWREHDSVRAGNLKNTWNVLRKVPLIYVKGRGASHCLYARIDWTYKGHVESFIAKKQFVRELFVLSLILDRVTNLLRMRMRLRLRLRCSKKNKKKRKTTHGFRGIRC